MDKFMFNSVVRKLDDRIQDYFFLKQKMGDGHATVHDAIQDIFCLADELVSLEDDE
jgi:hypothetical protein